MFIDYNIQKFLIYTDASILDTIKKIDEVKGRIKFVLNSKNECVGSISNGDILRWLKNHSNPNLDSSVAVLANNNFKFVFENTDSTILEKLLKDYLFIPILNNNKKLIGVAQRTASIEGFKIGNTRISNNSPCFVIAEIGNNHNGCPERAKKLIDKSIDAGADCVKFQMRQMGQIYQIDSNFDSSSYLSENLGTEYTKDLLLKNQLPNDTLFHLFDYCKQAGIIPLCTPWDLTSLRLLDDYGMDAFKFSSADLTNHPLILAGVKTKKPLLISTGMSFEDEIKSLVNLLNKHGATYSLLHCNSTYPSPFESINLNYLNHLKEFTNFPVGYSGHERGINVSIAATALGAKIIERHITTDKNLEGPDHQVSLLPTEFKSLVDGIREVEQSLGNSNIRQIGQGEMMNRTNLAKSIFVVSEIRKGEIISEEKTTIKSPGHGLQPCYINRLIGKAAKRDILAGECFYPSDLSEDFIQPKDFKFSRPWGIPVRFHDHSLLTKYISPDFVEFHLSYRDLELDFKSLLSCNGVLDFIVHCPELFEDDHILDLTAKSDAYRSRSIQELAKVIKLTREMKDFFSLKHSIRIVVNVGGFSINQFMTENDKTACYDRLENSLKNIDLSGVELLIQTMPPFPWHFGGQRFHNLFVHSDEIVHFCMKNGVKICLDTSHSKLACSYSKTSFFKFCEKVAPFASHLHIADSSGNDGEGLQIEEGDIDFKSLSETLRIHCPNASFIPEIWQGHENNGEGFWKALLRLEKFL